MVDLPNVQLYIFDYIVKWLYRVNLTDKTKDITILAKIFEVAISLKIKELEIKTLDTLTKEFFEGVMEKVSIHKDTSKEKENTTATFFSSFMNRAKTGIRGRNRDRAISQPIRTSMISHPFDATHITVKPFSGDPRAMPSLAEAKNLVKSAPENPESTEFPKSPAGDSAYRHLPLFKADTHLFFYTFKVSLHRAMRTMTWRIIF
ncbi:hypothetical protein TWF730_006126 [Orbilia blumenaviensis]|uniref:Uncharacterized protein n=1 Tax=Orbilia blumenaviensis TaxID=1796055 RepID=A0AAV9TWA3_9PEZI